MSDDTPTPVLRTLSPLLRGLERQLGEWLRTPRKLPLSTISRAELEGMHVELGRKAAALDSEQPTLIVVLMGGTGVGKSTLLNALAGANVAEASFTRPTTRDPVVYYHFSLDAKQFDPALKLCRLAPHNREGLTQKILVDTPDLDSNETANRDKLLKLLPVADIVLYVGSQEKYHDKLGWEIFKQQRLRRGFAFVLNKWDRCINAGVGKRPDLDLLQDLQAEGFESPLLFRTNARWWAEDGKEVANADQPDNRPAEGEQFLELKEWLETGLAQLEIEAIKARGVDQLLGELNSALGRAMPPDVTPALAEVVVSWKEQLDQEAKFQSDLIAEKLEPYQGEIEHHISVRGQGQFKGLMAAYLNATTRLLYLGSTVRDRLPGMSRLSNRSNDKQTWHINTISDKVCRSAYEQTVRPRMKALTNRLLVTADRKGMPIELIEKETQKAGQSNWEDTLHLSLTDAFGTIEVEYTKPNGIRKFTRATLTFLGNTLPPIVMVGSMMWLMWLYFVEKQMPGLVQILIPVYMTLSVLIILHLAVIFALPVQWSSIKDRFIRELRSNLQNQLERLLITIPETITEAVTAERQRDEQLMDEAKTVSDWLASKALSTKASYLFVRST